MNCIILKNIAFMIHHISIAVECPQHVATVLAQVLKGQACPFPHNPGSYVAAAIDDYGTMIEVYPLDTEMLPGEGDEPVTFSKNALCSMFSATHAAISVPVSQDYIEAIALREGWRVLRCDRGPFEVIELWVENRLLLELLPQDLAEKYLSFMQPRSLEAFLSQTAALV